MKSKNSRRSRIYKEICGCRRGRNYLRERVITNDIKIEGKRRKLGGVKSREEEQKDVVKN